MEMEEVVTSKEVAAPVRGRQSRARREFLTSPIEVLLTRQVSGDVWEALVRPGRKIRSGERVVFVFQLA